MFFDVKHTKRVFFQPFGPAQDESKKTLNLLLPDHWAGYCIEKNDHGRLST